MHNEEPLRLVTEITEQMERTERRLDRMIERNEEMLETLQGAREETRTTALRASVHARYPRNGADIDPDDDVSWPDRPLPLIEPGRRAPVPNRSGFLASYLDEWVDPPHFGD